MFAPASTVVAEACDGLDAVVHDNMPTVQHMVICYDIKAYIRDGHKVFILSLTYTVRTRALTNFLNCCYE